MISRHIVRRISTTINLLRALGRKRVIYGKHIDEKMLAKLKTQTKKTLKEIEAVKCKDIVFVNANGNNFYKKKK